MKQQSIELDGAVHYVELDGPSRPRVPPFVLVHGLSGSHVNWRSVASGLARHSRVVALDLPGFGRSPLAKRSAEIGAQRKLISRFLHQVVGEPSILVGNSMGGALSLWQAAEEPLSVAGLVLVCPAQPLKLTAPMDPVVLKRFATYSVPWLGEYLTEREQQRLGAAGMVKVMLELCCVDPARVDPEVLAAHVTLAEERALSHPWSQQALLTASRSLVFHLLTGKRRYREQVKAVRAPTLLLQGLKDRLIQAAASQALAVLRPDWRFRMFDHLGHVPMLEDPTAFLAEIDQWLDGSGLSVAHPGDQESLPPQ